MIKVATGERPSRRKLCEMLWKEGQRYGACGFSEVADKGRLNISGQLGSLCVLIKDSQALTKVSTCLGCIVLIILTMMTAGAAKPQVNENDPLHYLYGYCISWTTRKRSVAIYGRANCR